MSRRGPCSVSSTPIRRGATGRSSCTRSSISTAPRASTCSSSAITCCAATTRGRARTPAAPGFTKRNYDAYLAAVGEEARRAREQYDLLVIPGAELTYNDPDPDLAGHAVAVGLRAFVTMDRGLPEAMGAARAEGAAIFAAHPHGDDAYRTDRLTRRFWREWRLLGGLIDRYELFNQREVFSWVANAGLPSIACGDFHRARACLQLEDAPPLREDRGRRRRVPALLASRLHHEAGAHPGACRLAAPSPLR